MQLIKLEPCALTSVEAEDHITTPIKSLRVYIQVISMITMETPFPSLSLRTKPVHNPPITPTATFRLGQDSTLRQVIFILNISDLYNSCVELEDGFEPVSPKNTTLVESDLIAKDIFEEPEFAVDAEATVSELVPLEIVVISESDAVIPSDTDTDKITFDMETLRPIEIPEENQLELVEVVLKY